MQLTISPYDSFSEKFLTFRLKNCAKLYKKLSKTEDSKIALLPFFSIITSALNYEFYKKTP